MQPNPRRFGAWARLLAAVLLAGSPCGCGGKSYEAASVSGKITLDGRPLAGANVTFDPVGGAQGPVAGPGSYGLTDSQGQFTLSLITGGNGAVVGPHRVTIVVSPANEESTSQERAWADLGFEVPAGGSDSANFDLKTPPKKSP